MPNVKSNSTAKKKNGSFADFTKYLSKKPTSSIVSGEKTAKSTPD
jgi:hypothetical protein